jgi:hypothetical protein
MCLEKKKISLFTRLFRIEIGRGRKAVWRVVVSVSDGDHEHPLFSEQFKRLKDAKKVMEEMSRRMETPCFSRGCPFGGFVREKEK